MVGPAASKSQNQRVRPTFRTLSASLVATIVGCAAPAAEGPRPATRPVTFLPQRTVLASDKVVVPIRLFNGMPYAAVRVGGTTASFLIDTGSAVVTVLPKVADRERLPWEGGGAASDAAGGSVPGKLTHLSSITLGGVRFEDVDAAVSTIGALEGGRGPADLGGLLGWPAFSDVLLTVDYPGRRLVIRRGELPPPDGREVLPIRQTARGHLFIPVSLNGADLWAYPDTGCGGVSIILPRGSGAGLNWLSPPTRTPFANAHGQTAGLSGRLADDLRVGRYVVRRPFVAVDEARDFGVLGSMVLTNFAVTFDLRNLRLRLERPSDEPIDTPG